MLHGGRDQQVPAANVAFLRAQLAAGGRTNQSRELVYPEYTHFIPWEHPDAVERALQELVPDQSRNPALNVDGRLGRLNSHVCRAVWVLRGINLEHRKTGRRGLFSGKRKHVSLRTWDGRSIVQNWLLHFAGTHLGFAHLSR